MKVHFIAIGGTGMGALATLLQEAGHEVRGSDTPLYPPMSTQLALAGIEVFVGFDAANLAWGPDRVVVGNVCAENHPEVVAARARGIPLQSFPGMLEETLLESRRSLVIAGTHGKTTTSSLVAWLLRAGGCDPSWLVGGVPQNLGTGAHLGGGPAIVLEGDEYDTAFFDKKSKFLHYRPQRAILTSVEYDHADIFASIDEVRAAFRDFAALIPADGELIVHRDDAEAMGIAATSRCKVTTYRVLPIRDDDVSSADFVCKVLTRGGSRRIKFEIYERGTSLGEFSTSLIGRYNLANITAAIAMCRAEGVAVDLLRRGVARFRGVKRRQELLGIAQGVRVMEDFAHHPTAVQLTVTAMRRRYTEKALHVAFEPRSSSSRRDVFFEGYAAAFDAASHVYIAPVYLPEKVPEGARLDTKLLAHAMRSRGVDARAFDSIDALGESILAQAAPGDTVLLLSSGAFGGLGQRLLRGFGDALTFATRDDIPDIDRLMVGYGMPPLHDAEEVESLVIRSDEGVVGCVHLQLVDDGQAFLFGLAISPSRRGEGLGWVLADSVLRRTRTLGGRVVTLVAGDAAKFFEGKLGFQVVPLEAVDPGIRALANFQAALADGVKCMRFELPADD